MVSGVLDFYPDTQLALRLWNVYVKSVDPVLKILHIPTVQTVVLATILEPRSAQSSTVALTFAIYYAAVTAIYYNHEPIHLPCDGPTLLRRYKLCLDRLLTVNDLMMRPEMTSLQALAIYVVSSGPGLGNRSFPPPRWDCLTDHVNARHVYGPMKLAGAYGSSTGWRSASPNRSTCT
jgi:hypothetical protein